MLSWMLQKHRRRLNNTNKTMKCEMCGKKIDIEAFLEGKSVCQKCYQKHKQIKRHAENGFKVSNSFLFDRRLNSWMYKDTKYKC